jgi:hypothetical protein
MGTSVSPWLEARFPDKFRGWVGFSVPMAHRITAGCDILLMPSRFEVRFSSIVIGVCPYE